MSVTVFDGVGDIDEQIDEPDALVVPAGQRLHIIAAELEYLPAGQSEDELLPVVQKLPAEQGRDIAAT